jgi:hypothetical protein
MKKGELIKQLQTSIDECWCCGYDDDLETLPLAVSTNRADTLVACLNCGAKMNSQTFTYRHWFDDGEEHHKPNADLDEDCMVLREAN